MRPTFPALNLGLLRDLQSIIDFNAKVSDGTLQFSMSEQKLNSTQVFRSLIDQRRFRPSHRMRTIGRRVESSGGNPIMNDPGVLPGRNMRRFRETAGEQVLLRL